MFEHNNSIVANPGHVNSLDNYNIWKCEDVLRHALLVKFEIMKNFLSDSKAYFLPTSNGHFYHLQNHFANAKIPQCK